MFSKAKRVKMLDRDPDIIPVDSHSNSFEPVINIMFRGYRPGAPLNAVKGNLLNCIPVGVLFFDQMIYN